MNKKEKKTPEKAKGKPTARAASAAARGRNPASIAQTI